MDRRALRPTFDVLALVAREISTGGDVDGDLLQGVVPVRGLLRSHDRTRVDIRVPYPTGFFTKLVDGRVDDPQAGWKGKGLWTMSGTRTVFHNEGGTANSPKVYHLQVRPNPLAN